VLSSFSEERVLKRRSFPFIGMFTLLSISVLLLLYIFAAPTHEGQNNVSMLLFNDKSAIRRRPSLDSVPFAQAHEGTKLEVVQVRSDWVQVSIKTNIAGWVQSEGVTIIPPPLVKLSYRQIARRSIILLVSKVGLVF